MQLVPFPTRQEGVSVEYDYFVVRLDRRGESGRLSGLIERLGSGDKRWFDTAEQLVHLVALWPEAAGRPSTQESGS